MNEAILIVDDNASNLKLVAYALGLAGYRILRAESAEEAQKRKRKYRIKDRKK